MQEYHSYREADSEETVSKQEYRARTTTFSRRLRYALTGVILATAIGYTPDQTTDYTEVPSISLKALTTSETEPNDEFAQAEVIDFQVQLSGSLEPGDTDIFITPELKDEDVFFVYYLNSPNTENIQLELYTKSEVSPDTVMAASSLTATQIVQEGTALKGRINVTSLPTGEKIFIQLKPKDSDGQPIEYSLYLETEGQDTEEEPNNSQDDAQSISEYGVAGLLEPSDTDQYKFLVKSGTLLSVNVTTEEQFPVGTVLEVRSLYATQPDATITVTDTPTNTLDITKLPITSDSWYSVALKGTETHQAIEYSINYSTEIDRRAPKHYVDLPQYLFPEDEAQTVDVEMRIFNQEMNAIYVSTDNGENFTKVVIRDTLAVTVTIPITSQDDFIAQIPIQIKKENGEIFEEEYSIEVKPGSRGSQETQIVIEGYDPYHGIVEAVQNTIDLLQERYPNTIVVTAKNQDELFKKLHELAQQFPEGFDIWYMGHGSAGNMLVDLRFGDAGTITPEEFMTEFANQLPIADTYPSLFLLMCEGNPDAFDEHGFQLGTVVSTSSYNLEGDEISLTWATEDIDGRDTILGSRQLIDGHSAASTQAESGASTEGATVAETLEAMRTAIGDFPQIPSADTRVGTDDDSIASKVLVGGMKEGQYPNKPVPEPQFRIFLPIVSR